MQLHDLEYFLCIAETGSLRRAAQLCGVTQPAVTKALRRLENELQLTLVSRSPSGASLTDAGRSFIDRARRLCADAAAAMRDAEDLRAAPPGMVRVGTTPALVERLFVPATRIMMRQRPTTRFRVQVELTDELYPALRRGEVDLVLSGEPHPVPEDFAVHPLGRDTLYVVARAQHPLLARKRLRLADVAAGHWMLPRRGVLARDWLDNAFAAAGIALPLPTVEFGAAHDGLIPLILQSDLLSVAGSSLCKRMAWAGLAIVPLVELQWDRSVVALTCKRRASTPVIIRFLEILRDVGR